MQLLETFSLEASSPEAQRIFAEFYEEVSETLAHGLWDQRHLLGTLGSFQLADAEVVLGACTLPWRFRGLFMAHLKGNENSEDCNLDLVAAVAAFFAHRQAAPADASDFFFGLVHRVPWTYYVPHFLDDTFWAHDQSLQPSDFLAGILTTDPQKLLNEASTAIYEIMNRFRPLNAARLGDLLRNTRDSIPWAEACRCHFAHPFREGQQVDLAETFIRESGMSSIEIETALDFQHLHISR